MFLLTHVGPTQPPIQWVRLSFLGLKRARCGVDHLLPIFNAEDKKRVKRYLCSPLCAFKAIITFSFAYLVAVFWPRELSEDVATQAPFSVVIFLFFSILFVSRIKIQINP